MWLIDVWLLQVFTSSHLFQSNEIIFLGGRGVDYVLDTVSADSAESTIPALAFFGQLTCVAGVPLTKTEQSLFSVSSISKFCL